MPAPLVPMARFHPSDQNCPSREAYHFFIKELVTEWYDLRVLTASGKKLVRKFVVAQVVRSSKAIENEVRRVLAYSRSFETPNAGETP